MRKWTNEQIEYLKEIYINKSDQQITDLINKKFNTNYTKSAVNSKKGDLHLISHALYFKYSQEVIDYIIENHKGKSLTELANEVNEKFNLNVNRVSIGNLKSRLRMSQGITLEYARNDGCFKKGQTSFNKGKKWNEYMSEEGQANSRKTTFKKGNTPVNHREVGSERINVDGYIEIKVAEPNKWDLKHRVIYRQHYGEIPQGYNIIFLDGNKRNLNINNLKAVSKAEDLIMNNNGLFTTDREITNTGSILASVIDKVNKRKNERKKD